MVFGIYFLINIGFALLYLAQTGSVKNAAPHSFSDHFSSASKRWPPSATAWRSPATLYGHLVSTVEIFLGMFTTASITALSFARFATPRANLIFSDIVTIAPQEDGRKALTIRVASRRRHLMADLTARVAIWRVVPDAGGRGRTRRA